MTLSSDTGRCTPRTNTTLTLQRADASKMKSRLCGAEPGPEHAGAVWISRSFTESFRTRTSFRMLMLLLFSLATRSGRAGGEERAVRQRTHARSGWWSSCVESDATRAGSMTGYRCGAEARGARGAPPPAPIRAARGAQAVAVRGLELLNHRLRERPRLVEEAEDLPLEPREVPRQHLVRHDGPVWDVLRRLRTTAAGPCAALLARRRGAVGVRALVGAADGAQLHVHLIPASAGHARAVDEARLALERRLPAPEGAHPPRRGLGASCSLRARLR